MHTLLICNKQTFIVSFLVVVDNETQVYDVERTRLIGSFTRGFG